MIMCQKGAYVMISVTFKLKKNPSNTQRSFDFDLIVKNNSLTQCAANQLY